MTKILFICHGNICRSPMAEFVFKYMLRKQGLGDKYQVDSAATSIEELGNNIHHGTRRKLNSVGIPVEDRHARQITKIDYDNYDLLIAMDENNVQNIRRIIPEDPKGKIHKLLDYSSLPRDIADPWYTGNFDITYEDIAEGCRALIEYLEDASCKGPEDLSQKTREIPYTFHKQGSRRFLTFRALDKYEELLHLFTTRKGGVSKGECSSWNFGNYDVDKNENIHENFKRLSQTINIPMEKMVVSYQTHSCNVLKVEKKHMGTGVTRERDFFDVDAFITRERNIPIMTRHADCNSVYIYDPKVKAIGLAHSGWKGTLGHIAIETVRAMEKNFDCRASDMVACTGPALCVDCFEVDEDVATLFFTENEKYREFSYAKASKSYIDLKKIIKYDLMQVGIREENISDAGLCTKCNNDMFFSHRGQGSERGLMVAVMMLK